MCGRVCECESSKSGSMRCTSEVALHGISGVSGDVACGAGVCASRRHERESGRGGARSRRAMRREGRRGSNEPFDSMGGERDCERERRGDGRRGGVYRWCVCGGEQRGGKGECVGVRRVRLVRHVEGAHGVGGRRVRGHWREGEEERRMRAKAPAMGLPAPRG